jgi:crossover junction endodeoxyribonuclease RuvC
MGHELRITLGIDPGSRITGYGIVLEEDGNLRCLDYGILQGSKKDTLSQRLLSIGQGLEKIFSKHQPHAVAIEKTFFAKNVDSVTKLGHARGVCLYEATKAGVPIFEYNPTEIKLNIVGHGRAGKDQVQILVRQILKLNSAYMTEFDMSDALALAIHHSRISTTLKKIKERELLA